VPAHTSMLLALVWDGPYPASAEQRPLAAVVDATAATITASGATTVASPYQLLWYAATPGGQGDSAGTTSFFIGNTTETPFIATGAIRIELWTFPLPSVRPITTGGTRYAGERALE